MKIAFFVILGLAALYFLSCFVLLFVFLRRRRDDPESTLRTLEGTPMERYLPAIRKAREWYPAQKHEDISSTASTGCASTRRSSGRRTPGARRSCATAFTAAGRRISVAPCARCLRGASSFW
jgi:hypothetical protein